MNKLVSIDVNDELPTEKCECLLVMDYGIATFSGEKEFEFGRFYVGSQDFWSGSRKVTNSVIRYLPLDMIYDEEVASTQVMKPL